MNLICGWKKSDYRSLSVIASETSDLTNNCFTLQTFLIKDHCKKIDLKGYEFRPHPFKSKNIFSNLSFLRYMLSEFAQIHSTDIDTFL